MKDYTYGVYNVYIVASKSRVIYIGSDQQLRSAPL
jgi:hypothetical protein